MLQFTLYDVKFSFINCHLETGQNKTEARLQMAQEVLKEIGLYPEKDMIEQDALKDINFFMGIFRFSMFLYKSCKDFVRLSSNSCLYDVVHLLAIEDPAKLMMVST